MSGRNARNLSAPLPAILVAVAVLAGTAPPADGRPDLPGVLHSQEPASPNAEVPSRPKTARWRGLKLPRLHWPRHKLGTEVVGGVFGGAVAGGVFGSFAGPAGTAVGAGGGALAGAVRAVAASKFKDYARRHWGWH
jgi:hypothetical protein